MMTLVTSSRRPGGHRLEQRVVLAVDRQHGRAGLLGAAHEQRAGADQPLLVGERERRAALDRGERGLKPGRAGDRADHPCRPDGAPLPRPRRTRPPPRCRCPKAPISARRRRRDRRPPRNCAPSSRASLAKRRAILVRGQRLDGEAPVLALEQVDRARPDRAGGAEDRHAARRGFGLARLSSIRHQITKRAGRGPALPGPRGANPP